MNKSMLDFQNRAQDALNSALSNTEVPSRLLDAMRYSTLAGGKRFRAMLVYAAGTAFGASLTRLDAVAAAIECIHAYSLIHDDLPAMDNDDLRRGQATSHIKFDPATAILAGDALQTIAFELINSPDSGLNDSQARFISLKFAQCAGQVGMVGGQMLDIQSTDTDLSKSQLEDVHRRKTGALINAAAVCGAVCHDDIGKPELQALEAYADNIGLAFQVVDDILDIESTTEQLGKPSGADIALGKATYPAILGMEQSKLFAQNLYQEAIASIATISDNTQLLRDLADLVINRKN